jgi:hypothetical protein
MKLVQVDKAKEEIIKLHEEIRELERFIEIAESYEADTFEKKVIKEYAFIGNVATVATKMNEAGYSIEGRKLISNDISEIIKQKPIDELHKFVRKSFMQRRKGINRRYN